MRERARIRLSFRPSSSGVACLMPLLAEEEWRWISAKSGRQVGCRIRWTGRQHPKHRRGSEDLSSSHWSIEKGQQRRRRRSIWLFVCLASAFAPAYSYRPLLLGRGLDLDFVVCASLFRLSSLNFLTYLSSRFGCLNLVSLFLPFVYLFLCPLSLLPLSLALLFGLLCQCRSLCLATLEGCVERFGGQVCGKRTVVVVPPYRLSSHVRAVRMYSTVQRVSESRGAKRGASWTG